MKIWPNSVRPRAPAADQGERRGLAIVAGVRWVASPAGGDGRGRRRGAGPLCHRRCLLGVFASTLVYNLLFMNLPIEGPPIELRDFFKNEVSGSIWLGIAGAPSGAWAVARSSQPKRPPKFNVGPRDRLCHGPGRHLIKRALGTAGLEEFKGGDTKVTNFYVVMLVPLCLRPHSCLPGPALRQQ